MPFAPGEDKMAVGRFLYMCPKQGFYVFFRIIGNLLKFVYGDDTGSVGFVYVFENFVQRVFRSFNITQFEVESGEIADRVESESTADGLLMDLSV